MEHPSGMPQSLVIKPETQDGVGIEDIDLSVMWAAVDDVIM